MNPAPGPHDPHAPSRDPYAGLSVSHLSDSGRARRDEILADMLARAPGIRRARAARRLALGATPVALVLIAALGARFLSPPQGTDTPMLEGPLTFAPDISSTPHPTLDAATLHPTTPTAAPDPESPVVIRVVSTAGREYDDLIVTAASGVAARGRIVVETVDDETLMRLLAREGRADGLVHVGGRTMLASDLSRENPAMPGGNTPVGRPIPADPALRGL